MLVYLRIPVKIFTFYAGKVDQIIEPRVPLAALVIDLAFDISNIVSIDSV